MHSINIAITAYTTPCLLPPSAC